jgi:hypothetical protein
MLEIFPEIKQYAVDMAKYIKSGRSKDISLAYLCEICKKNKSR